LHAVLGARARIDPFEPGFAEQVRDVRVRGAEPYPAAGKAFCRVGGMVVWS
jgi:hypothetical protein